MTEDRFSRWRCDRCHKTEEHQIDVMFPPGWAYHEGAGRDGDLCGACGDAFQEWWDVLTMVADGVEA